MASLKHPAALIVNGRIIMKGVSFNACMKKAITMFGDARRRLFFFGYANVPASRGQARARVEFYAGKSHCFFTPGHQKVEIVPVALCPVTTPADNLAARMVAQALGKPAPEHTEECAQDDGVLFSVPMGNTDLQFTGPAWMWLATALGLVFNVMMLAFVFSL